MNKKANILTIIIFISVIAVMAVWFTVAPFREYSAAENRYLSKWPEFSISDLTSGSYTEKVEDCISDQFPLRDDWVIMNSAIRRLSGRSDSNGIYFGNRLTETFWNYDKNILNNNLIAIDQYSASSENSGGATWFVPVPNRVYAAAHEKNTSLPPRAPDIHQDVLIDDMKKTLADTKVIDTSDAVAEEASEMGVDALYYGTDHHTTTYGAYKIYTELGSSLGYSPLDESEYNATTVCEDFEGTTFHKSGAWWVEPDSIERWDRTDSPDTDITVSIGAKTYDSMYDNSALDTTEKYNYFLYGNNPLMIIKNKNADSKLLVVKDSYAHAILPFLAEHYGEIHVIDLRYYRESVSEYRQSNGIDKTLIIYNVKNLTEDTNLKNLN